MNIRNIGAEIYSCCEILNELFINFYRNDIRYRGTSLKNGYNANFTTIYKTKTQNGSLTGVHSDIDLNVFYYESADWYITWHDIRTQETHYEIGQIVSHKEKIMYLNNNRNGVGKYLYTNPSTEIFVEVAELVSLADEFLGTRDRICKIIDNFFSNT